MSESPSTTEQPETGVGRRSLIKRAAAVGVATAWATPVVQSMAAPAFAVGSAPGGGCTACITGGGNDIIGGTYNGGSLDKITVGLGQICCTPNGAPAKQQEITVVLHPTGKGAKDVSFNFRYNLSVTCTKTGSPAPPPQTEDCANRFTGTVEDADGNVLSFILEDNGEPGQNVDYIKIQITGPTGSALGSGLLAKGNLQVHAGLGPIVRDCSGC